jgi:phosphohistidine phosphatase
MKTLLILRHAKSSWKQPDQADHDRPLNERGKSDAPRVGRLLREEDLVPDLIVSSTAKRARKTAAKVAEGSGYGGEIQLSDELYLAPPKTYLGVLRQVADAHSRVMVVGHNPGLEELLTLLTGDESSLPTAALAYITLPIDRWSELNTGTRGHLVNLWTPKEF